MNTYVHHPLLWSVASPFVLQFLSYNVCDLFSYIKKKKKLQGIFNVHSLALAHISKLSNFLLSVFFFIESLLLTRFSAMEIVKRQFQGFRVLYFVAHLPLTTNCIIIKSG